MSIGGAMLALGSYGYFVRVHNPTDDQATVQIWSSDDNELVAEYLLPDALTEDTVDRLLEKVLIRACEDLTLH
jgi:hypothetical protein